MKFVTNDPNLVQRMQDCIDQLAARCAQLRDMGEDVDPVIDEIDDEAIAILMELSK